eukprot:jgi/Hompol1/4411/HPOL_003656-RA
MLRPAHKEEIFQDADIDVWKSADFSWSDEAMDLKQRYLAYQQSKQAQIKLSSASKTNPTKSTKSNRDALKKAAHATRNHKLESSPAKQDTEIFSQEYLRSYFRTMRLHGCKINQIDSELVKFVHLKELSLTGNLINQIQNIPESVEILHLNANLVHTLDAKSRHESVQCLETLPNLKILSLQGNPICLLPAYRSMVMGKLLKLMYLDELPVSEGESYSYIGKSFSLEQITKVKIRMTASDMSGVAEPVAVPTENPEQPLDEYHFSVQFALEGTTMAPVTSTPTAWTPQSIDCKFSTVVEFPVSKQLRDALCVRLLRRKLVYVLKPIEEGNPDEDGIASVAHAATVKQARDGSASNKKALGTVGKTSSNKHVVAPQAGAGAGGTNGQKKAQDAKAAGRPTAAGSAKGKRGAKEEPAVQWVSNEAETIELGRFQASLKEITMGQPFVVCDNHFQKTGAARSGKDATDGAIVGTLRTEFRLNPKTE